MQEPLPTVPAPDPAGPPETDWSRVEAPGGTPRSGFGVGVIVARTFRTWWQELPAFALLGLASAVAAAWATYRMYGAFPELLVPDPSVPPWEPLARFYGRFGGVLFLSLVLWSIQTGAIAHGAARRLRGARVGVGEMLGVGLQRSFAIFGVTLVSWFAITFTACTVAVPCLLAAGWAAAWGAVVVDRAGPIRALGRSWALTQGHRWKVLGALVIVLVAYLAVFTALQAAVTGGMVSWPGAAGGSSVEALQALALPMAILQLVGGLATTILPVTSAVIHHGLCLVKEGGDPVHLSQVFE
jgi:hypothetical protein